MAECASIEVVDVLVVFAHPDAGSLCGELVGDVTATLSNRGHDVEVLDLYAENFDPVMSRADRIAYETEQPIVDEVVERHAELVRSCQGFVFIYPTIAAGLPAILKGWLDRVLVRGVAFELDPRTSKVKPAMRHVRRIGVVTTSSERRSRTFLINDAGRRTLLRTVRLLVHPRARSSWLALRRADRRSEPEINMFRDRVRKEFSSW